MFQGLRMRGGEFEMHRYLFVQSRSCTIEGWQTMSESSQFCGGIVSREFSMPIRHQRF